MEHFIMGAIAMASAIVAMYFFRFWRDTRDRLFAMFGMAFVLLGLTRLGLAMSGDPSEGNTSWYWVRFVSFVIILVAIADKNARPR